MELTCLNRRLARPADKYLRDRRGVAQLEHERAIRASHRWPDPRDNAFPMTVYQHEVCLSSAQQLIACPYPCDGAVTQAGNKNEYGGR